MTVASTFLFVMPFVAVAMAVSIPEWTRSSTAAVAAATGLGWAAVIAVHMVTTTEPATVGVFGTMVGSAGDIVARAGDLHVTRLAAAGAAGTALVVAATAPRSLTGRAAALLAPSVLVAGAGALEPVPMPFTDRPLGAGLVLLAGLAVVVARAERLPLPGTALAVAGTGAIALGLVHLDPMRGGTLVIAGGVAVAVATAAPGRPGLLLAPAALVAGVHLVGIVELRRTMLGGADTLAAVGGVSAVVGVVVIGYWAMRTRAPAWVSAPAVGVVGSLALLGQVDPDQQAVGVVLGGGAVVAAAAATGPALVALLPGVTMAISTYDGARGLEQHLVGAALVVGLVIAVLAASPSPDGEGDGDAGAGPLRRVKHRAIRSGAAAVYAVVPVWGWSGVDADRLAPESTSSLLVGVAAAAVAAVGVMALTIGARTRATRDGDLTVDR